MEKLRKLLAEVKNWTPEDGVEVLIRLENEYLDASVSHIDEWDVYSDICKELNVKMKLLHEKDLDLFLAKTVFS